MEGLDLSLGAREEDGEGVEASVATAAGAVAVASLACPTVAVRVPLDMVGTVDTAVRF